jgi:hypothetical protein
MTEPDPGAGMLPDAAASLAADPAGSGAGVRANAPTPANDPERAARAAARATVRAVRYMGTRPRRHTNRWILVGQDGGQSIVLGDRTLFAFSDTLLAARTTEHPHKHVPLALRRDVGNQGVFLANCGGTTASTSSLREAWATIDYYLDSTGFPRELLTPTLRERAQEIRFWPEHGVAIDGQVFLYYLGVQTTDPTTIWGFRNVGSGLARLDHATGECERILHHGDWKLWRPLGLDMHFGVQVLREGDWCYIFGNVRHGLFCEAIVARVPTDRFDDVGAYVYLQSTAPEWSTSLDDCCNLGPCAPDFSVSFNEYLGRYLMLYVDAYYKTLTIRLAEHVWGPYSDPLPIVAVPHAETTELVYLAFEHPHFTTDGGRTVFVSYCQPHFTNNSLLALKFR